MILDAVAVAVGLILFGAVGALYTLAAGSCLRRWAAGALFAMWLCCSAAAVCLFFWQAWGNGAYAHNPTYYRRVLLPQAALLAASAFGAASIIVMRRHKRGQVADRRTVWLGAAGFAAALVLGPFLLSGLDRLTCANRPWRAPTGEVLTECEMYRKQDSLR